MSLEMAEAPVVIKRGDPITRPEAVSALRRRDAGLRPNFEPNRCAAENLAKKGRASLTSQFENEFLSSPDESLTQTRSALTGLLNTLSDLSAHAEANDQHPAYMQERMERVALAAELDRKIAAIKDAEFAFRVAATALQKRLIATFQGTKRAQTLSKFMFIFGGQMTTMLDELAFLRDGTAIGSLPLTHSETSSQFSEPVQQLDEKRMMFSLGFLKWREAGDVKLAPPFTPIELPIALIPAAIAHELIDDCDSERVQQLMATHDQSLLPLSADDERLVDLDALCANPATETVTSPIC